MNSTNMHPATELLFENADGGFFDEVKELLEGNLAFWIRDRIFGTWGLIRKSDMECLLILYPSGDFEHDDIAFSHH